MCVILTQCTIFLFILFFLVKEMFFIGASDYSLKLCVLVLILAFKILTTLTLEWSELTK